MMRIKFVIATGCFTIITLTISVATAVAQSSKLPNPADPSAAAPTVKHESAFSDYQPFREQKIRSWKEVNQEVANNPGMDSMKDMPSKTKPGKDSKTGDAPKSREGAAGHDMGSMKNMPDKTMPDMDSKTGDASKTK